MARRRVHFRALVACPPLETLQTFARGECDQEASQALVHHLKGCATCRETLAHEVMQQSLAGRHTNPDSPRASARLAPRAIPTELPLEDTHVAGERDATPNPSGVKKGDAFDRYVILDRLGSGGMGEVYAAWDPMLDRKVAIKVLKEDFEGADPLSEELKQRLLVEAQSLARLSHPNVVTVHDVGLQDERIYLAMEFAEGQTLTRWLSKRPPWRKIVEVFLAAGEGLAAAHGRGITHRDFKPDNVIVGPDGRVRVMDFGLAQRQGARDVTKGTRTITQPGAMLGTPAYMSPEALHGRATDPRSDEFSFCVALYEALYGRRPFEGVTPAALASEIDQNHVLAPPRESLVPRRLFQIISKGLRADPAERFQGMRALLVQLGRSKAAHNRRILLAIGLGALAISASVSLVALSRARARCSEAATRVDTLWNADIKSKANLAFQSTRKPWADTAWRDAEARLDAYASAWRTERIAACENRERRTDEDLAQELLCLSRRLSDFGATATLFSHADDEVVERAVSAAANLPSIAACRRARVERSLAVITPLQEALSEARAELDAGKYARAATLALELSAKGRAANDRAVIAEASLLAALAKLRLGDLTTADALLEDSILSAQLAHDSELEARGWIERVGVAALTGPSVEADSWVRFAEAALERVEHPPELSASMANNLGTLAYARGDFLKTLDHYAHALELRKEAFGPKHPLVARSHSNLGIAFKALGRLDDARAEYERALALEEEALDSRHPQVADTLNNLGNVLEALGRTDQAKAALERALRIKEAAYGANSLPVAVTLTNLGSVLANHHDPAGAAELLERALTIKADRAGVDALTVAITLTNLAHVRRTMGHWRQSIELDTRALGIRTLRQGTTHVDLAFNLTGLGEAHVMLGERSLAIDELERALRLRAQASAVRGTTTYWLARALEGTKERARVKRLYEEAVRDLPADEPLAQDALRRRKS